MNFWERNETMKTEAFYFDLPEDLIAQEPSLNRGESRLFVVDRKTKERYHTLVKDIASLIPSGAVMVFNDSRVRKARIYAQNETGANVEFLLVKKVSDYDWETLTSKMKKRKIGSVYTFPEGVLGTVLEGQNGTLTIRFNQKIDDLYLNRVGHIPLPPYIKREDKLSDEERYQTLYSKNIGSSAAPTAGLHFTDSILASLDQKGVERVFVTLHVGLGTFMPVRVDEIEKHVMHEEFYSVPLETKLAVDKAKREGRPVIACGTTSVRTLESAWDTETKSLQEGDGSTKIFLYPGKTFHVVDELFTNFHTPESTLLMLVSAFAGYDFIMDSYKEAVINRYRFFSYGDAMLIK